MENKKKASNQAKIPKSIQKEMLQFFLKTSMPRILAGEKKDDKHA